MISACECGPLCMRRAKAGNQCQDGPAFFLFIVGRSSCIFNASSVCRRKTSLQCFRTVKEISGLLLGHWIWVRGPPLRSARRARHFVVRTAFVRRAVAKFQFCFAFMKLLFVVGRGTAFCRFRGILSKRQKVTVPIKTRQLPENYLADQISFWKYNKNDCFSFV